MVSLMRDGPRMLFVATSRRDALIRALELGFDAQAMEFELVFDRADEFNTLLYLVSSFDLPINKTSITDAVLVKRDVASLLCALLGDGYRGLFDGIRPAPHTIIMRAIGDMDKMIKTIQADFGGELGGYEASLEGGSESSVVVGLTDKPLNRSARLGDMHPTFLRADGDYATVKRGLKMHAFGYVNSGIDHKSWHELEIRIFDSYGAFEPHYERLVTVLDSLELGLVLGEAWTTDYPRILLAVEVYSLRFFTFKEPKHIKRVLMGLEHLADGARIVDYDLFYKNKKVYWIESVDGKAKGERKDEAAKARAELYERLDDGVKAELELLERKILKTRSPG